MRLFLNSVAGVQAANIGKMTSIGIESILYEAKYVFKDFTNKKKRLYRL
jgi:beta-phosphoglucomutase